MKRVSFSVIVFLMLGIAATAGAQFSFTPIGDLDGSAFLNNAQAISRDGKVITGYGTAATAAREAFLCRDRTMISVGDLPKGETIWPKPIASIMPGRIQMAPAMEQRLPNLRRIQFRSF
jgi:probable HAF family extracellular repeat protein